MKKVLLLLCILCILSGCDAQPVDEVNIQASLDRLEASMDAMKETMVSLQDQVAIMEEAMNGLDETVQSLPQSMNDTMETWHGQEVDGAKMTSVVIPKLTIATYRDEAVQIGITMKQVTYEESWSQDIAYVHDYGRHFRGRSMAIEVMDSQDNVIDSLEISGLFSYELSFDDFFTLEVNDYTGEGILAFGLGQRLTSDVYTYHLFGLKEGEILALTSEGSPLISSPMAYSPTFETSPEGGITTSVYSKEEGTYVDLVYRWNGSTYVIIDE